jgi:hypothetical protein
MKPYVSVITLGVRDLKEARRFYAEGLGWPIHQDYEVWVAFNVGGASAVLGLHPWDGLAGDAGVPADGEGFRGVTLSYLVRTDERVDEVLAEAERAGGSIVRPGERAPWGGYFGYFADPEGHLWKVAAGQGEQPLAE